VELPPGGVSELAVQLGEVWESAPIGSGAGDSGEHGWVVALLLEAVSGSDLDGGNEVEPAFDAVESDVEALGRANGPSTQARVHHGAHAIGQGVVGVGHRGCGEPDSGEEGYGEAGIAFALGAVGVPGDSCAYVAQQPVTGVVRGGGGASQEGQRVVDEVGGAVVFPILDVEDGGRGAADLVILAVDGSHGGVHGDVHVHRRYFDVDAEKVCYAVCDLEVALHEFSVQAHVDVEMVTASDSCDIEREGGPFFAHFVVASGDGVGFYFGAHGDEAFGHLPGDADAVCLAAGSCPELGVAVEEAARSLGRRIHFGGLHNQFDVVAGGCRDVTGLSHGEAGEGTNKEAGEGHDADSCSVHWQSLGQLSAVSVPSHLPSPQVMSATILAGRHPLWPSTPV